MYQNVFICSFQWRKTVPSLPLSPAEVLHQPKRSPTWRPPRMECSPLNYCIHWILEVFLCTVLCGMNYFSMDYDHRRS